MTGHSDDAMWNRRTFIKATGATAGAGLLAGCAGAEDQEYTAETVVLPEDAQEELRFAPVTEETQRRTIEETVAGQDISATIESSIAVYAQTDAEFDLSTETESSGSDGSGSPDSGPLSVGVLSTPAAETAGQSLNPLARLEISEILTSDQAEQFLNSMRNSEEDIEWERGPEQLSTAEGTMLGESTTIETHAGILSGDTTMLTYLHLTRVETEDSVVLSAGVQSSEVEDTTRPFVGPDGYLTGSDIEEARSQVADVNEALVVE